MKGCPPAKNRNPHRDCHPERGEGPDFSVPAAADHRVLRCAQDDSPIRVNMLRRSQRPVQAGARLPRKASTPSLKSALM